jgi:hypothetical protein
MMRAPGEKSEMAKLMEMVQNDAESSHPPSPHAILGALAIAKHEKVAKSVNSWSMRVGLVAVPRMAGSFLQSVTLRPALRQAT